MEDLGGRGHRTFPKPQKASPGVPVWEWELLDMPPGCVALGTSGHRKEVSRSRWDARKHHGRCGMLCCHGEETPPQAQRVPCESPSHAATAMGSGGDLIFPAGFLQPHLLPKAIYFSACTRTRTRTRGVTWQDLRIPLPTPSCLQVWHSGGQVRMRMKMRKGLPKGKSSCSVLQTHSALLRSRKCRRVVAFSFPTNGCCRSP